MPAQRLDNISKIIECIIFPFLLIFNYAPCVFVSQDVASYHLGDPVPPSEGSEICPEFVFVGKLHRNDRVFNLLEDVKEVLREVCYGSGGPVSRILSSAFIYLGPARCRGPLAAYPQDDDCSAIVQNNRVLPIIHDDEAIAGRAVYTCCLALLRVEFTVPLPLPEGRCALTAPFHPCRRPGCRTLGRSDLCGTFQGLLLPVVSRHPALWSSDFPLLRVERANARPT